MAIHESANKSHKNVVSCIGYVIATVVIACTSRPKSLLCYAVPSNHYIKVHIPRLHENSFVPYGTDTKRFGRQLVGDCVLNDIGLYGTIDTTSDVYEVQYLYQVSVLAGTSRTQLNNEIIQQLDAAITTAVLPRFFACTNGRRRYLQSGTVTAISSMPVDTYILSGLSCAKVVLNSDCYVVQGFSTVIATDFRSVESLEIVFKEAVQAVLQENTIVASIGTSLVLDVSSLTDSLEISPPIPVQPQPQSQPQSQPQLQPQSQPQLQPQSQPQLQPQSQPQPPISSPIRITTASPIAGPVTTITFAPIPSPLDVPSFRQPTIIFPRSVAPSIAPTISTTETPTLSQPTPDTDDTDQPRSENGGPTLDWWSWLLIAGGGIAIGVCCFTIIRTRGGSDGGGSGGPSLGILASNTTAPAKSKTQPRKKNTTSRDQQETDDEEPPYEPPPSITPYSEPAGSSSETGYRITPPPMINPPMPSIPAPPPVFVNNTQDDDDDDDEVEEGEEEEDYTEEEEEDLEAGEDAHHDEGEVFEDEESYYEEEEDGDFEEGTNPSGAGDWRNQQPTFGGLY